jgi:hypothetical protein
MTAEQFIEFGTHPGTIVRVSDIVSIEKLAVAVSGKKRKRYVATGAVVIHTLSIFLTGRGSIELVFDSEALCTATLKMLKMALTPLTIRQPVLPLRPLNPVERMVPRPLQPGGPAKPAPPEAPAAAKPQQLRRLFRGLSWPVLALCAST